MANLRVLRTGKDGYGDITALCGSWGRTSKSLAIREIEQRLHIYYVKDIIGRIANVEVVNGSTGKYLRTERNSNCSDNLDNLPDC
ncbi:MAG: DUF3892 domain-containing protein [Chloroflexi bacterium]|nr:DUF3892 domain-containing protein [Chloroflexota bacterium]